MTAPEPVLVADGLEKCYVPGVPACRDVSLRVPDGGTVALLGPSGCGKTTVLRLVGGFEVPDKGTVTYRGSEVSAPGRVVPPHRRGMGMVFQEGAVFPHLTVRRNAAFGLRHMNRTDRDRRVGEVLDWLDLGAEADRWPHELSGGQRQRVALARALAPAPGLLLLDEPFTSLDLELRRRLAPELADLLRRTETPALMVTHDPEEALTVADVLVVMAGNTVVQSGAPREVLRRPATRFVAGFVGPASFLPGRVERGGAVRTELGLLGEPAPDCPAGGCGEGRRVDVLFRPHHLKVCRGDHAHPDGRGATVRVLRLRWLGDQRLADVVTPEEARLTVALHGERVAAGDSMDLCPAVDEVIAYPAEA